MSPAGKDDEETRPSPDQAAGVLGNLPHTRPAVRSPRRAAAPVEPEPAASATKASAAAEDAAPGEGSSQAELEALARTGIAIAGGAASLGLRIAGRAAAALRGAVDRS